MRHILYLACAEFSISLICGPSGILPGFSMLPPMMGNVFIVAISLMPDTSFGSRPSVLRACGILAVIAAMMSGACLPMLVVGKPYFELEMLRYALFSVLLAGIGLYVLGLRHKQIWRQGTQD